VVNIPDNQVLPPEEYGENKISEENVKNIEKR
jgi:hypothetical protein